MNSTRTAASLFSSLNKLAAGAGALGGLLSYFVGETTHWLGNTSQNAAGLLDLVFGSALWSGAIGLTIGAVILIADNLGSLRGQWHRDVLRGLPLFFALSFAGGAAGQIAFSLVQNSLTRGIGWALMGTGVGVGIGLLRRDGKQAARGALGGGIGGLAGGLLFDVLAQVSSAGDGSFSRLVGQITMGALIAFLMRVVQDALKDAYLLGVSTGPYEGKEYPLNTARVSVGRAPDNDISLFREESAPLQLGALLFGGGNWRWQGETVSINDAPQNNAPLTSGDTLQLGATRFRFYTRAPKNAAPPAAVSGWKSPPVSPISLSAREWSLVPNEGEPLLISPEIARVSVGRGAQNTLIFSDAGVSSNHATLQIADGKLLVCDLNSTNGTSINGVRIAPQTPQPLQNGDRLRFGNLEVTVRAA